MNWQVRSAVAGALMFASAGTAQAATVTFDLSGSDPCCSPLGLPFSFTLSGGPVNVTVSGHSIGSASASSTVPGGLIIGTGTVNAEKIGRYSGGVGIVTATDDDHQVDGRSSFGGNTTEIDEFVQFSFNQEITILSADFSFIGGNDDFRWLVDTNMNGSLGVGDFVSSLTDIPGSTIFSSFNSSQTSVFGIGAFGSNDEWKLKSVTIDFQPNSVVIPIPATLPLMAGCLGVFRFLGSRRRHAGRQRQVLSSTPQKI